jgi:Fe-S-cluster containining protein
MEFETITKLEHCLECRGCCRFAAGEKGLAPILTAREFKEIRAKSNVGFSIRNFKKSKKIFQLKLKKSRKIKDLFICPFFEEKLGICLVNKIKFFECRLAPFIFIKERDGKIFLARYADAECPSLAKISRRRLGEYIKYLKRFCKNKGSDLLASFPELAWACDQGDLPRFSKIFQIK